MPHRPLRRIFVPVAGIVLVATLATTAGPILFEGSRIPDETVSLANLRQFRLTIVPFPEAMVEQGLDAEEVRASCIHKLEEAGYRVVEDYDQPHLWVALRAGKNPDLGDFFAFGIQIKLFQEVQLRRLDRALHLPTYATAGYGISTPGKLHLHVHRTLDARLDVFLDLVERATEHVATEGGGKGAD